MGHGPRRHTPPPVNAGRKRICLNREEGRLCTQPPCVSIPFRGRSRDDGGAQLGPEEEEEEVRLEMAGNFSHHTVQRVTGAAAACEACV